MPEHHARGFLLKMEKIQLRAQPPVVALLRLLDHHGAKYASCSSFLAQAVP